VFHILDVCQAEQRLTKFSQCQGFQRHYKSIAYRRVHAGRFDILLTGKLDDDQLLSSSSTKYIKQVLDSYGSVAGTTSGLPRGVGISAYLAELYLRPVDRKIRAIPGLVLYCRFVDDIVAVFARPPAGNPQGSYKNIIIEALTENGLSHNPKKTKEFNLGVSGKIKFEYLGYRFILDSGQCAIWPSAAKISKYKMRMNAAFSEYEARSPLESRRAYRDLVSRMKFLTGNTRLSNNKSSATTGIYYSNSIVTEFSSFELLDKLLKAQVERIKRPKLRKRLKKYKFADGFSERRFHNFSARELQTIVRAWKHG
jgi:Reverse transcriptase (RNA-dependent DNA polymerase)